MNPMFVWQRGATWPESSLGKYATCVACCKIALDPSIRRQKVTTHIGTHTLFTRAHACGVPFVWNVTCVVLLSTHISMAFRFWCFAESLAITKNKKNDKPHCHPQCFARNCKNAQKPMMESCTYFIYYFDCTWLMDPFRRKLQKCPRVTACRLITFLTHIMWCPTQVLSG